MSRPVLIQQRSLREHAEGGVARRAAMEGQRAAAAPAAVRVFPEALIAGPLAALVASLPAGTRTSLAGFGVFEAWIAITGLLCVPLVGAIAAARLARRSLEAAKPGRGAEVLGGVALWVLLTLPADALLGAYLHATTHHRALGGATFAVFVLFTNVVLALVAWRLTRVLRRPREGAPPREGPKRLGQAALALLSAMVLTALVQGHPSMPIFTDPVGAALADGSLVLAVVALGALVEVPKRRLFLASCAGGAATFASSLAALSIFLDSAALLEAVIERAPVAAAVAPSPSPSAVPSPSPMAPKK